MRILCAALASPGFLYPAAAVSRALRARGHDVRLATDVSFTPMLEELGFERLSRGKTDGPSFTASQWFEPLSVAMQVLHLRHAAESFAPDVVLSSHLTLGPVIFCRARQVPLVILGPIVYLWPLLDDGACPDRDTARTALWRHRELGAAHTAACRELGLVCDDDGPLLGDRYLLQSVPALTAPSIASLPAHVRHVGSCLLERAAGLASDVWAWIQAARRAKRKVVFIQLGRTFGTADPWPALEAWAASEEIFVIASLERYDRMVELVSDRVLLRNGIALEDIVPFVDLVVCSGHPSPLLAAAKAGKPALIACSGSGTEEHARAFERYGCALAFTPKTSDASTIAGLARRLLGEESYRIRAAWLRAEFGRYDGPARAADEVEAAAAVRVMA